MSRGHVDRTRLRADFALALSAMYGREVPAYATLVEVATEVNTDVLAADPAAAQRFGSIGRVTAERHGAIRLGTPGELRDAATVFAAFGMFPVGFYDLREAAAASVPVVSTAFRPIEAAELARNPFRVFTSMLMINDRRFFTPALSEELARRLASRRLFGERLLALARRAVADDGLDPASAAELVGLATAVFELSTEPVDRTWYEQLATVSAVAADIGGVGSTHINHLTPRVLDIDELYRRMTARGITMIAQIQGPPRWDGPDVLLRQTSFRALAEPRRFREADGRVTTGALRVRFGEVEARGIALTPAGRAAYDEAMIMIEQQGPEAAPQVWAATFGRTEAELDEAGHAWFRYRPAGPSPRLDRPADWDSLLRRGVIVREPIVYEDFLPRSAAGIFASNLTDAGLRDDAHTPEAADAAWLSGLIDADIADPFTLYRAERDASIAATRTALRLGDLPATVSSSPR